LGYLGVAILTNQIGVYSLTWTADICDRKIYQLYRVLGNDGASTLWRKYAYLKSAVVLSCLWGGQREFETAASFGKKGFLWVIFVY
jgi:hypothetical protein